MPHWYAKQKDYEDQSNTAPRRRVIREALRLYPPAWTILRVSTREANLAGRIIPAGSTAQGARGQSAWPTRVIWPPLAAATGAAALNGSYWGFLFVATFRLQALPGWTPLTSTSSHRLRAG